jgi:hypothetical protein
VGTAHLGNCSTKDSTLVSVVNILTPSVSLAISPGTQICIGDLVSFTATSANGGSNPAYKWYVNGVQVAGVNTWYWSSSTLMTGDVVHCVFVGDWPCLTKPADTSNKFTINASGNVPPAVNIRATPSLSVPLGTAITFAATPVNGGNFPNYRWVKNGATVKYGKSNIYIATTGKDIKAGDKIEAILVSDLVCANPDSAYSNTLTIGEPIILTGVGNTINGKPVQIYPNPAKDQLIVEGLDKGIAVQLTDVLGKVVFNAISNGVKDVLNISALATGTYVLHLRDDEGNHSVSKVVVSR